MAQAIDLAQALDVQVDQLARRRPFVAVRRRLRLQRLQLAEPQSAQHRPDGGARHAQRTGDNWTAHPAAPQLLDLGRPLRRGPARTSPGRRAAIVKSPLTAQAMPPKPGVASPLRYAGRIGRPLHRPALVHDPGDHHRSTRRRQAGILMNVHPGSSGLGLVLRNPSFSAPPRVNNLHSFDI